MKSLIRRLARNDCADSAQHNEKEQAKKSVERPGGPEKRPQKRIIGILVAEFGGRQAASGKLLRPAHRIADVPFNRRGKAEIDQWNHRDDIDQEIIKPEVGRGEPHEKRQEKDRGTEAQSVKSP